MATNPSTLPENFGRITAPDANYPYGSAKDDSTGTTGDGTPIKKALLNDTYGIIQAALRAAGTAPSGNAENATGSQVLQAINGLASGLANTYTDTGAADAYVLELKANQQKQPSLFDGLTVIFEASNANTDASTVDVSGILGQSPGTTVRDILQRSLAPVAEGQIRSEVVLRYNTSAVAFEVVDGSNSYTSTEPGYLVLQNGLIVQWGAHQSNVAVDTIVTVNFPVVFPNNCFIVLGTHSNGGSTTEKAQVNITDYNTAGLFQYNLSKAGAQVVLWVAIGN